MASAIWPGSGGGVGALSSAYSPMLRLLEHIFMKSLWSGALKSPILGIFGRLRQGRSLQSGGKLSSCTSVALDLTLSGVVRIVFLVAPNGSERSEMLGSRKHGANRLLSVRGLCCVRLVVWVLFVNSIVCLFVFMPVFCF